MDLSILIPVYNWDLSLLLCALRQEMESRALAKRVEIIVMDDFSNIASHERNAALFSEQAAPYLRYARLDQNVGRAAIRNLLAAKASGEFLLFLDCDVVPDGQTFIQAYLSVAEENRFDVVCGGISYLTRIMEGAEYDYHAYLGNRKEVKAAAERNREPWRHILTSNIMVRKSVFQGTHFDERFTGYGYEDIEWGVRLAQNYRVVHIDNTASHLGLVTKVKAYDKMRNSVGNYLLLRNLCPAAFESSIISRVVWLFALCSSWFLKILDRGLRHCFLSPGLGDRYAFFVFQLNFAVLLALAIREQSAVVHQDFLNDLRS